MIKKISYLLKKYYFNFYLKFKNFLGIVTTQFRLRSGELFIIRNVDRLGIEIINGDSFEGNIQKIIMAQVKSGMTVLDIGANIGFYTVQMAGKIGEIGKVVAFEPNPIMVKQLVRNITINNFNNVIVEPIGLSDNAATIQFHLPDAGLEAHGSFMPNSTFTTNALIDVRTEKLDTVLERLNINKVDFIKMDVEGAESKVFSGATRLLSSQQKPIIIFECAEITCNSFGHRVYDVLTQLVKYGYMVEQVEFGNWLAIPIENSITSKQN